MSQSVAALSSSARVVIVGVRDYDKPWAQTAEGALHDAIAWWHYAVGRLGVHPQNIRLLTSPRLGARDLVEAVARPDDALRDDLLALARATPRAQATGANISASVDWLMAWRGQKLLTFSGHGVAAEALLSGANAAQADLSQFLFAGADHVRVTPKEYASYFSGDGLTELVGATPLHRLAPGKSKPGAAGDGPEQAPPPTGDSPDQSGRFDEAGAPVISRALPRWAGELRAELGIGDRVLDALGERPQKAAHRLGLFSCEFRRDHDDVAVELDAVIRHQHHDDVVDRHAARLQVDEGGVGEAEDGIDLTRGEHRLANREADILQPHLAVVELVDRLEDRPLRERR
jgi:hypothetical protein